MIAFDKNLTIGLPMSAKHRPDSNIPVPADPLEPFYPGADAGSGTHERRCVVNRRQRDCIEQIERAENIEGPNQRARSS